MYRKWRKWVHDEDTVRNLFPEKVFKTFDPFDELFDLDMSVVLKGAEKYNSDNGGIFGYLPRMCRSSPCQLGALNAQSICERIISRGNNVVTKNRMLLEDDTIEKMVVLKINQNFMQFSRKGKDTSEYKLTFGEN